MIFGLTVNAISKNIPILSRIRCVRTKNFSLKTGPKTTSNLGSSQKRTGYKILESPQKHFGE